MAILFLSHSTSGPPEGDFLVFSIVFSIGTVSGLEEISDIGYMFLPFSGKRGVFGGPTSGLKRPLQSPVEPLWDHPQEQFGSGRGFFFRKKTD